jgi:ankyrin repeat protein
MKKTVGFIGVAACGTALALICGCQFIRNDNLNQAIVRGETEVVRKAIASGAHVNGRGMHAITPLMAAAGAGHLEICKMLVMHGADVNGHNDSASVLMMAAGSRKEEVVRFILESGADKAWTNAIGQTAEEQARQRGLTNIEALVKIP